MFRLSLEEIWARNAVSLDHSIWLQHMKPWSTCPMSFFSTFTLPAATFASSHSCSYFGVYLQKGGNGG